MVKRARRSGKEAKANWINAAEPIIQALSAINRYKIILHSKDRSGWNTTTVYQQPPQYPITGNSKNFDMLIRVMKYVADLKVATRRHKICFFVMDGPVCVYKYEHQDVSCSSPTCTLLTNQLQCHKSKRR